MITLTQNRTLVLKCDGCGVQQALATGCVAAAVAHDAERVAALARELEWTIDEEGKAECKFCRDGTSGVADRKRKPLEIAERTDGWVVQDMASEAGPEEPCW